MSGVRNFVRGGRDDEGKSTPPPPPSAQSQPHQRHGRLDRSFAHQFKVKRGEKPSVNHQIFGQPLASTAPAPGYNSNSNPTDGRNNLPNPQYQQFRIPPAPVHETGPGPQFLPQQEQHVPLQGGAFDDTLTSGLEDTKSDMQYNGDPRGLDNHGGVTPDEDGCDRQGEELHNQYLHQDPPQRVRSHSRSSKHITQHDLQHTQSRSPLLDAGAEQQQSAYVGQPTHGISGRFQAPVVERWQQDIADRTSPVQGQRADAYNKRGHSGELDYENDDRAAYDRQQGMGQDEFSESEDEDNDEYESPEEAELPEQRDGRDAHHPEQGGGHNFEPRSEGAESTVSAVSRRQARRDEVGKALKARYEDENRFKLDHKDEELEGMTYTDLKKETWDGGKSGGKKRTSPTHTQNTEFTAKDYFIHMVREGDAEAQVKFFEQMSMAEYEEAGDFFIDKFTELMKQIKDSRKKKRDLVTNFENEIEAREKAVRGKSESFERKFEAMRAGGEGVLNSKV